jgi:hypothetical protein
MTRGAHFLFVLALFASSTALGHVRSESFSYWQVDGESITMQIKMSARDVMSLNQLSGLSNPNIDNIWREYGASTISVFSSEGQCELSDSTSMEHDGTGILSAILSFECPNDEGLQFALRGIFESLPGHIHFGKTQYINGMSADFILTSRNSDYAFARDDASRHAFGNLLNYAIIGVEHIWTGWDHLAFLLGVFLIARTNRKRLLMLVTGFTVGHSISLALAVTGMIVADRTAIEAIIGFSVLLLGLDCCVSKRQEVRHLVLPLLAVFLLLIAMSIFYQTSLRLSLIIGLAIFTFSYLTVTHERNRSGVMPLIVVVFFGLIHGVAFADVLREFIVANHSVVSRLIAFNIGVEIGQVLMLIAFAVVVRSLARFDNYSPRLSGLGHATMPAALIAVGAFWFLSRSI